MAFSKQEELLIWEGILSALKSIPTDWRSMFYSAYFNEVELRLIDLKAELGIKDFGIEGLFENCDS